MMKNHKDTGEKQNCLKFFNGVTFKPSFFVTFKEHLSKVSPKSLRFHLALKNSHRERLLSEGIVITQ